MYCSIDDLKKQVSEQVLIRLVDDEDTDPDNLADAGPELLDRLDTAITKAADEINGYCQLRYPVPFNPVPGLIRSMAVDIALYNLFSRRGYDEDTADKSILDRYKSAVKTLEFISKGIVTLGVPAPKPAAEVNIQGPGRVFSREKMSGY